MSDREEEEEDSYYETEDEMNDGSELISTTEAPELNQSELPSEVETPNEDGALFLMNEIRGENFLQSSSEDAIKLELDGEHSEDKFYPAEYDGENDLLAELGKLFDFGKQVDKKEEVSAKPAVVEDSTLALDDDAYYLEMKRRREEEEKLKHKRPDDYDSSLKLDMPGYVVPLDYWRTDFPPPELSVTPIVPFNYEQVKAIVMKAVPRFFINHIYHPTRSIDRVRMLNVYLLRKLYNLGYDRRKIVVVTKIQERMNQASRGVVRYLWSDETDGLAHCVYENPKFVASAVVFLIYMD